MPGNNLIAKAEIVVNAPVDKAWDALINPVMIKKYMFGTTVVSEWKEGSKIIWKGEWKGKPYEDKGEILKIIPGQKLQYTHFSPLSGMDDIPENYHTVTIDLADKNGHASIVLSQDKNETEEAKAHSEKNWGMVLSSFKNLLEEND
ncbi:MAG: Activator of Hsp90 ATPase 1 family protein [Chitinophagaceae bacterium]|nr:Activator of Hsp90 ATPase 1 family protein [Chitinophagaceae bacterium]